MADKKKNPLWVWIDKVINGTTTTESSHDTPSQEEIHTQEETPHEESVEETPTPVEREPKREKHKTTTVVIEGNNIIEKQSYLTEKICDRLRSDFRGMTALFSSYELVIVLTDSVLYTLAANDDYKKRLAQSLSVQANIEPRIIRIEKATTDDCQYKVIAQDVLYGINIVDNRPTPTEKTHAGHARITAMQGSIKGGEVLLNSESATHYNIGAMSQPYPTRTNHIAIDETDSNNESYNSYVSREHAHITYSREHGYLLFADRGGTRDAGKRTHIVRNDEWIEVENTIVPKSLLDGDIIVLTRKVYLRYEEL